VFAGYLLPEGRVGTAWLALSPGRTVKVILRDQTEIDATITTADSEAADATILLLKDPVSTPPFELHVGGPVPGGAPPLVPSPEGEGWPLPGTPCVAGRFVLGHFKGKGPGNAMQVCPAAEVRALLAEGDDALKYVNRREQEDLALRRLEQHQIVVLLGPQGVGKSVVTRHLVERLRSAAEDSYVIFADIDQFVDGHDKEQRSSSFLPWLIEQWKDGVRRASRDQWGTAQSSRTNAGSSDYEQDLTGPEREQLWNALRTRFPTRNTLERFASFKLGTNLNQIAGAGGLDDAVFELMKHAKSRGRTGLLVEEVCKDQPEMPELQALSAKLGLRPAASGTPSWTKTFTEFVDEQLARKGRFIFVVEGGRALRKCGELRGRFYSMLRDWHQRLRTEPWSRLSVIMELKTIDDLSDGAQSPLNFVTRIVLSDFTLDQAMLMAKHYKLEWEEHDVRRLWEHVGGHPGLLALAISRACQPPHLTLWEVLDDANGTEDIFKSHLRHQYSKIQSEPEKKRDQLSKALIRIIGDMPVVGDDSLDHLDAAGFIKWKGTQPIIRCPMYEDFLRTTL
jgi:hypothetical protein